MPARGEELGDADKRSKMRGDAPPGDTRGGGKDTVHGTRLRRRVFGSLTGTVDGKDPIPC